MQYNGKAYSAKKKLKNKFGFVYSLHCNYTNLVIENTYHHPPSKTTALFNTFYSGFIDD